jgi:hypothetical protein
MANPDSRFGFLPQRHLSGTPWSGGTMLCSIPATDTVAMFIGDLVKLTGAGDQALGYGEANQGILTPEVDKAVTASTAILGSIVSWVADHGALGSNYRLASTLRQCVVALATPDVVFIAQDDGGGTPAATTWPAELWDISGDDTAGSTSSGYSGQEIDTEVSTTDHFFAIRPFPAPDNDPAEDNCIWELTCNSYQLASQIGVAV